MHSNNYYGYFRTINLTSCSLSQSVPQQNGGGGGRGEQGITVIIPTQDQSAVLCTAEVLYMAKNAPR